MDSGSSLVMLTQTTQQIWQDKDHLVRLVELFWQKGDPDPKRSHEDILSVFG